METQQSGLESPLILDKHRGHNNHGEVISQEGFCQGEVIEELQNQVGLALPLVAVSILQYSLQVIAIMFVGHLGELPLSGASMATSFAAVTGFSVLLGLGSALETLCGQAFGAKQYHMLGIYMQRGMLILQASSIVLAFIWFYTSNILKALGQDHDISAEAGKFNQWMIPGLFAYGFLQCLNRFLQTQNIVIPMVVSAGITALLHIVICWLLVFKIALGSRGASLANAISYWINVLFLVIYINYSPACSETWIGFSKEALHDILSFVKLAIPTAIMIWQV